VAEVVSATAALPGRRRRTLALTLAATVAAVLAIGRETGSGVDAATFTPPAQTATATSSDPDLTPGVVAALEARVRSAPRSPVAREALGTAYLRLQRWNAAERQLRALVRLAPKDDYAYFALGHALVGQGQTRAAKRAFANAESLARR
jgi:tetratricopeptide (TPR) repeat protein